LGVDPLPTLSWSSALGKIVAVFPWEVLYCDPVTKDLSPVRFTFPVTDMQVAGFASGAGTDAVLGWSPDRSTWSVITQTAAGSSPFSTFGFTTGPGIMPSLGIRPVPLGGQDYARVAVGDFDGDGVPDIAFAGVNAAGQNVIAYLLSRERDNSGRFTQVHTLLLGLAIDGSEILSVEAVPLGNRMPGANTLSVLAVHEAHVEQGTAELALFSPQPATGAALATGSPATSFLPASTISLPKFLQGNPPSAV